jgi:hypothetical protein
MMKLRNPTPNPASPSLLIPVIALGAAGAFLWWRSKQPSKSSTTPTPTTPTFPTGPVEPTPTGPVEPTPTGPQPSQVHEGTAGAFYWRIEGPSELSGRYNWGVLRSGALVDGGWTDTYEESRTKVNATIAANS